MIEIIPNWHPIFVHFTVALLSVAVVLFVAIRFVDNEKWRRQWEIVAQWNLWLGALITLVTVAMGVVAYNTVAHDTPSHEAMTEHRNWALVTSLLFVLLALWSALRARAGQGINTLILIGLVVGAGLLFSTAWHGGEAVYRYGLGVMSLPKPDSHAHAAGEPAHNDATDHPAQGQSHPHDAANTAAHNDSQMQKDDVVNCELPETASPPLAGQAPEPGSRTPHDPADGHAHGTANVPQAEPTASNIISPEAAQTDGHRDHQH